MQRTAAVETMDDQQRERFLSSRDRHPPNAAINFIENRVSVPGQPRPIFSERSGAFVSLEQAQKDEEDTTELWKQFDGEIEALFQLMEQVQKKLQRQQGGEASSSMNTVNLRQCSWQQVMDQIDKTAGQWKRRPSKEGKAMVFVDKVGKHSAALESWLGLLPTGDYGSSICGVFQLAIGAAGQYSKVEETVLEALAEIPKVLESARRYAGMYQGKGDHFLQQRTFELFRAIISVLRQIMQFFADSKSHKVFGVLGKQGAYKEDLVKGVDEIKARAQAVNEEAAQCNSRLNVSMYGTLDKMSRGQDVSQSMLRQILGFFLTHPLFAHDSASSGLAALEQDPSRLQASAYDLVNVDYTAVSDNESISGRASSHILQTNAEIMNAQREMKALIERLFELLNFDEDSVPQDTDFTKTQAEKLGVEGQTRAAAMTGHKKFKDFLTGTTRCLLVNGREDISRAEGMSPLSWVVAIMMKVPESLTRTTAPADVLTLVHFCAMHKPPLYGNIEDYRNSSSRTMLASLICQLISHLEKKGVRVELPALTDSHWKRVRKLKPKVLIKIFRSLVEQIPKGTRVFCMIDDITWYEKQALKDETCHIVDELVELALGDEDSQDQDDPRFSLLVTSQNYALYVKQLFPRSCVVDLDEQLEGDDAARFIVNNMATSS